MPSIPLLIFAKTPVPGQVKTRLQSHCSPEQSAEIAKILLEESLNKACRFWPGETTLMAWPDANDHLMVDIAQHYGIEVMTQADGDLGDKMAAAAERHGYPVAIIGSDTPHISERTLKSAYDFLQRAQNVIGPSSDGGYYLLGLARPEANIFRDIEWGTSSVLQATMSRAQFERLEEMTDIDHWQDVLAAQSLVPPLHEYLIEQSLLVSR